MPINYNMVSNDTKEDDEILIDGNLHPDYKKKKLLASLVSTAVICISIGIPWFWSAFYVMSISNPNFPNWVDYAWIYVIIGLVLIAIILLVARRLYANAYFQGFYFRITPTEVIIQHGVTSITQNIISISSIQKVRIEKSFFDRKYDLANIIIETEGLVIKKRSIARGFIPGQKDADIIVAQIRELMK